MNYPAASGRGIKNYKPQMPSPQSGGVLDPKGNKINPSFPVQRTRRHNRLRLQGYGFLKVEQKG
jgi:hypothetical protein